MHFHSVPEEAWLGLVAGNQTIAVRDSFVLMADVCPGSRMILLQDPAAQGLRGEGGTPYGGHRPVLRPSHQCKLRTGLVQDVC